jgi:hypothetical protein
MTDYREQELQKMINMAVDSSPELGALDGGLLIDYETGKRYQFADEYTAIFLASSRGIVLELARRIRQLERATTTTETTPHDPYEHYPQHRPMPHPGTQQDKD